MLTRNQAIISVRDESHVHLAVESVSFGLLFITEVVASVSLS